MKKAHGTFFLVAGQSIYYRADQNFQKSSAAGVKYDGYNDPDIWIGEYVRQNSEKYKTDRAHDMGEDGGSPISNRVKKLDGQYIGDNLHDEIDKYDSADLFKGETISALKNNKKQRRQIIDDGLRDISCITGIQSAFICVFHGGKSFRIESGHKRSCAAGVIHPIDNTVLIKNFYLT